MKPSGKHSQSTCKTKSSIVKTGIFLALASYASVLRQTVYLSTGVDPLDNPILSGSIITSSKSDNKTDVIANTNQGIENGKSGTSSTVREAIVSNGAEFHPTPFHKHIYTKHIKQNEAKNYKNGPSDSKFNTTRITFELHDPKIVPLTNSYNLYVTCKVGDVTVRKRRKPVPTGEKRSGVLPPSLKRVENITITSNTASNDYNYNLQRSGRILDFTTTISTDLKILLIGDSVMAQLAESFDEMTGGVELQSRQIIWEAWTGHEGGTVVGPTRGGGVSAFWRMTGLLSQSMKGKPPANAHGGGWSYFEIGSLLDHRYRVDVWSEMNAMTTVGAFDAVVFRVMHGWMEIEEITRDRLVEAIDLSYELLGVKTVILMNVPFTNNVKTMDDYWGVQDINDNIRHIADTWHENRNDDGKGVQHVLVQDYDAFYNHVIWANALHLGYNVSNPLVASRKTFEVEGQQFLFDRLNDGGKFSPSISMVCDTRQLTHDGGKCDRNILWMDGMHVCPETMTARYGASIACLLGCVYNGESDKNDDLIRECEKECNEQFMSVMPADEAWISSHTTMASFSG